MAEDGTVALVINQGSDLSLSLNLQHSAEEDDESSAIYNNAAGAQGATVEDSDTNHIMITDQTDEADYGEEAERCPKTDEAIKRVMDPSQSDSKSLSLCLTSVNKSTTSPALEERKHDGISPVSFIGQARLETDEDEEAIVSSTVQQLK